MRVLVTAGSTRVMIDQVRAITNIFRGRTGTNIAQYFSSQGCEVTLITSEPSLVQALSGIWVERFRTFDELAALMEKEITEGDYDVVIHSAAVSDYQVSQVCVIDEDGKIVPIDASSKVSSSHDKVYLEMVPTFKIIDKIRDPWGFSGVLVKFKLQVQMSDEQLLEIAHKSRQTSDANIIVANCLEWAYKYAYIITEDPEPLHVHRTEIGICLYNFAKKALE